LGERGGDGKWAVVDAEGLPCCIDFWACGSAEDVFFEEGAVELCWGIGKRNVFENGS